MPRLLRPGSLFSSTNGEAVRLRINDAPVSRCSRRYSASNNINRRCICTHQKKEPPCPFFRRGGVPKTPLPVQGHPSSTRCVFAGRAWLGCDLWPFHKTAGMVVGLWGGLVFYACTCCSEPCGWVTRGCKRKNSRNIAHANNEPGSSINGPGCARERDVRRRTKMSGRKMYDKHAVARIYGWKGT